MLRARTILLFKELGARPRTAETEAVDRSESAQDNCDDRELQPGHSICDVVGTVGSCLTTQDRFAVPGHRLWPERQCGRTS